MLTNKSRKPQEETKEPIFIEDFTQFDFSKVVWEGPIEKKAAKGAVYFNSFAYYLDDDGKKRTIHFLAPEQFCFGPVYSYPPGQQPKSSDRKNNDEEKKPSGDPQHNGIQLTYFLFSKDTKDIKSEDDIFTNPELRERWVLEMSFKKFLDDIQDEIVEEVARVRDDDEKNSRLPGNLQGGINFSDNKRLKEKSVKPCYDPPPKNKPEFAERMYLPVLTTGIGARLHSSVKFRVGDDYVNVEDLLNKRGNISPIILWEGFSWNGKTKIIVPKFKVTEGYFEEQKNGGGVKETNFLEKGPRKGGKTSRTEEDDDEQLFGGEKEPAKRTSTPKREQKKEKPIQKKDVDRKKPRKKTVKNDDEDPIAKVRDIKKRVKKTSDEDVVVEEEAED